MGGGEERRQARPRPLIRLNRKRLTVIVVVLLVLGGCGKLCAGYVHNERLDAAGLQSRQNIHAIQLAVERYAVDSGGEYPRNPEELIKRGYLRDFPLNAYSGLLRQAPGLKSQRSMRPLRPGEYCPGDFLYLPITETYSGESSVGSYVLVLCGYFDSKALGKRPPVTPSSNGLYDYDTAAEITEAYRRPSTWR